jgi:hypothetical protein
LICHSTTDNDTLFAHDDRLAEAKLLDARRDLSAVADIAGVLRVRALPY